MASSADDKPERLVPLRINIEQDGYKFRDQFTWNIADKTVTVRTGRDSTCLLAACCAGACLHASSLDTCMQPLMFATILVQDAELPATFKQLIAKAIHDQLEASKQAAMLDLSTRHAHLKVEVSLVQTAGD